MHVAVAFILAIAVILLLVFIASASPIIGIPIFVVFMALGAMWARSSKRMAESRVAKSGAPSTTEASYDPRVDPAER
jgi:hypothetical protein